LHRRLRLHRHLIHQLMVFRRQYLLNRLRHHQLK
jgi:hypothetical protein